MNRQADIDNTTTETEKRPSFFRTPTFFGRWLAGADGAEAAPAPSPAFLRQQTKDRRALLVQKLTIELKQSKKSFQLSAEDVRLLLNLPSQEPGQPRPDALLRISEKSGETMDSSATSTQSEKDFVPPPPLEKLPSANSVFNSWDMSSSDVLTPEEIQAIMLALTAANDGETSSHEGSDNPLALLKKASVRRLVSEDGSSEFLVTLQAEEEDAEEEEELHDDGQLVIPTLEPAPFLSEEDELRFSGSSQSARREEPVSDLFIPGSDNFGLFAKPDLVGRQFSIQPFPDELEPAAFEGPRPQLECREASVRPVALGRGRSFVISLPSPTQGKNDTHRDKPPARVKRQVTLQRQSTADKTSFRMNGMELSFRVSPFKAALKNISEGKNEDGTERSTSRRDSTISPSEPSPFEAALKKISKGKNEDDTEKSTSGRDSTISPLEPTMDSSWDLRSSQHLLPEETQAVMLALTAFEQAPPTRGIKKNDIPLEALKQALVRQLPSPEKDTNNFLITFGEDDGPMHPEEGFDDKLIVPIPDNSPVALSKEDKPDFAARQFSIQPFPEEDSLVTTDKPQLGCRQASVRPVALGRRTSYVVSLPSIGSKNNAQDKVDKPPASVGRQVSVQRQNGQRAFRMNGKELSFHVTPFEAALRRLKNGSS